MCRHVRYVLLRAGPPSFTPRFYLEKSKYHVEPTVYAMPSCVSRPQTYGSTEKNRSAKRVEYDTPPVMCQYCILRRRSLCANSRSEERRVGKECRSRWSA